nr:retrotransposon protein, putative, Ty3-gypsy subclass [Tanacetum cinerariifolium]GEY07450.1 retrotransposon protein, putative, Ty3-gypsy subclass [Tanacetum cinerariifolium]
MNNAPVIIEAKIFRRKVGRVYMDSGSSCEIIYEHCFEKLNSTIKATKVDLKTPLVGFSRERSWSNGEVLLEITIGYAPLSRTETLNFIIVRSNSLHNMLLGRTAMQRKILATNEERILSCVNAEEKIIVNDQYPDQMVTIGKQLPEHFKKELHNLLKSNADIFAWTHVDMTRILRTIMAEGKPFNTKHKLNEYSHVKPINENKRGLCPDRNIATCKETEELTKAGILRKMPFGLKNAGAIYHRLVNKVFSQKIGRNLEAYVEDMVIKSTSEKEMLKDIQETFERFLSINMKLNLNKCSFGVEEGPFLGHLITKQGIEANPLKVKAVTDLDQLKKLKDKQSLNGKLATLSRVLSKGRVAKWAIELREHDIVFLRRNEKEMPADFLVEIPFEDNEKKEKPKEVLDSNSKWRLYTDRASNSDRLGAGIMLMDPEGKEYTYALRFEFETTNNEAKYEALLAGLRIAQEMEIAKVAIFIDSQVLVNQIKGTVSAKQTSIKDYLQKVKTVLRGFEEYTVEHIRKNQNKKADALSKLASMTFEHLT